MKLERITKFTPAFDKRDPDSKKNFGIGCVRVFMVLKGDKGAVHFVFGTGMFLESTMDEYAKEGRLNPSLLSGGGTFRLNAPMGYDVGYCSLEPHYEGQVGKKDCEWLGGKTCYSDGSAMRAETYMNVMLEHGGDKVWEMLEEEYNNYFNESV